jgi:hypothetical protein
VREAGELRAEIVEALRARAIEQPLEAGHFLALRHLHKEGDVVIALPQQVAQGEEMAAAAWRCASVSAVVLVASAAGAITAATYPRAW